MKRLRNRNCWMVVTAMIALLPIMARAQTGAGSVAVNANVSETVALSTSPNSPPDNVRIEALSDFRTLTLTLSGYGPDAMAAQVPILIRSNTGYVVSALVQSQAVNTANFAVLGARPTGRFVALDAIENLKVPREPDGQSRIGAPHTVALPSNLSSPLVLLRGSRISLTGTLNSPDNALEVNLLITVKPDVGAGRWFLSLTLSGLAGDRF